MDYKTLYEAELTKNKKLKEFRDSVIDTLKCDDDLKDSEIIDMIDEMENDWDPNHYQELKEHYEKTMSKEHGWGNAIMAEMYEKKDIENEELKEQIFGINNNDMKIEGFAEQVVRLSSENKILKDKSKGFKTLFREVKKLTKELGELKKYETMIHCVWSDLYWADKACVEVSFKDVQASCDYYENEEFVKKEVVDDSEEEESSEEEEEEKLMSPDEYTQDWLETQLSPDDVGDEERYIVGAECQKGFQDIFEGDMAHYYDDNKTKMCPKMEAEWREEFPHKDDDIPYFHDDVGVLADNIEQYYLNTLKIPKSKMDEWRESYEKEMYGEEES